MRLIVTTVVLRMKKYEDLNDIVHRSDIMNKELLLFLGPSFSLRLKYMYWLKICNAAARVSLQFVRQALCIVAKNNVIIVAERCTSARFHFFRFSPLPSDLGRTGRGGTSRRRCVSHDPEPKRACTSTPINGFRLLIDVHRPRSPVTGRVLR